MKTIFILIFMILLYACNTTNDEKTVSIIDYKNSNGGEPKLVNPASHKNKDVNVFRINQSESYSTVMYRLDNGKLKAYQSGVTSNDNYDIVVYKWINDSTLSYKLVNSSNRTSQSFLMIGNKDWTRLEEEK
jgi:hypothetical protein